MAKEYLHNPVIIRCASYDETSELCKDCPCDNFDASLSILYREIDAFYYVFNSLDKMPKFNGITDYKPTERLPLLLSVPYITNGAFACELALKYILIDSKVTFQTGKGHNLKYLFELLPNEDKNEITNHIVVNNGVSPEEVYDELSIIANSFVDRRYMFTTITESYQQSKLFAPFVHTVCKYVLGEPSDEDFKCYCNCCDLEEEDLD